MAGPAIEATVRVLKSKGPGILQRNYFEKYQKTPGWAGRMQAAAGPHKFGNDPHIMGRALDIILRANVPWELQVANELVTAFLNLRPEMQWAAVIYNNWEWNSAGQQSPRGSVCEAKPTDDDATKEKKAGAMYSCMHLSHIHIEWGPVGIENTSFESSLSAAVGIGVSNPTEDLLVGTWAATIGDWNGIFKFGDDLTVQWSDPKMPAAQAHRGKWSKNAGTTSIEWKFSDDAPGFQRTFHVPVPITPPGPLNGTILPAGQGFFKMQKQPG